MFNPSYPTLSINTAHIYDNYNAIIKRCQTQGIAVSAVVKASEPHDNSYRRMAEIALKTGCHSVGDSRLNTIVRLRQSGYTGKIMLLRIPMPSELGAMVEFVDISLQSSYQTIVKTNDIAKAQNKVHNIVLMADLGDLREGYYDHAQLIKDAIIIEKRLDYIHLAGVGTNLGCYGAVVPDVNNLTTLVTLAKQIEQAIGRKLDIVSGGATTSLPLVYQQTMPKGINHLRIGEGALLAMDLHHLWQLDTPDLHRDCYTITAEIIELKDKPSHPIGTVFVDAFGDRPTYRDIGIRKRALLAIGKRDIGAPSSLLPRDENCKIIGASSDHLIIDITNSAIDYQLGDTMSFSCFYQAMVYANQSQSVRKVYLWFYIFTPLLCLIFYYKIL